MTSEAASSAQGTARSSGVHVKLLSGGRARHALSQHVTRIRFPSLAKWVEVPGECVGGTGLGQGSREGLYLGLHQPSRWPPGCHVWLPLVAY